MSVTAAQGFRAAGVTAGLKASGRPDVALVVNDGPLQVAAGVFTSNRVVAAPVIWSRQAVSDGVAFGYLADVYVLAPHRGRGLGRALVSELVDAPTGRRMRWLLHTADMHRLYAGLGFGPPPASVMEREADRSGPAGGG